MSANEPPAHEPSGGTPGERLYQRWCRSETTDRARYFHHMNPADKEAWEALAASVRADFAAAGRRTNAIELTIPAGAPGACLLVRPSDRVKHVARQVARLSLHESHPMQRWTLEVFPDQTAGEVLDPEHTVNEAGLGDGDTVIAREL